MNRARKENESFEDYKKDLKKQSLIDKAKLKGKLIWNSASIVEQEILNEKRESLGLAPLKIKVRKVIQGTFVKA